MSLPPNLTLSKLLFYISNVILTLNILHSLCTFFYFGRKGSCSLIYLDHLKSFVCTVSTVQCFLWINSNHVRGCSGTRAAVSKVYCICDAICCLVMDWERLQRIFFSWKGARTLIKFHVLLGKTALECYKSLKRGLGTLAASYEAFRRWTNAIKNGQKETVDAPRSGAPTSATDEGHMEKWNPSLNARAVFHVRQSLKNSKPFGKCLPSPHQQLGKRESLCTNVLNHDQRAMHVLLATTHLQLWRN